MLTRGKKVNVVKPSQRVTIADIKNNKYGSRSQTPAQLEDDEILMQNVLGGGIDQQKI